MDTHAILTHRLRQLADEKGWSLNRLADFAGISRGSMSTLMGPKGNPTLRTMEKIAKALEVEAPDLLRRD